MVKDAKRKVEHEKMAQREIEIQFEREKWETERKKHEAESEKREAEREAEQDRFAHAKKNVNLSY